MNDKMEQSTENLDADNAGQDKVFQVTNNIFGVDLLLDMILDHLIHDDEGNLTVSKTLEYRLVSKAWLLSINRIFRKANKPLFVISMDEGLGINPMHKFFKSVTGSVNLDKLVPPYAIKATGTPIFFDCLSNYGSGMIELELEFPKGLSLHHASLTNNFLLPRLCNFTLYLFSSNDPNEESSVMDKIKFIQKIFDASKQLKSFTLFNLHSVDGFSTADSFGNLLFPPSITHLDFRSPNASLLEALENSHLPNLKTLKLYVKNAPIKNGLITSVLQKFQKTLETIYVFDGGIHSHPPGPRRTSSFQLPLMEKLKELYISTPWFELDGGHGSYLRTKPNRAPVLKKMALCRQTRSLLRQWTYRSCFPNVTVLNVSMVREDTGKVWNSFVNFDLATMQALHLAFPNVKELSITQKNSSELTAIHFIMREMTSLQCLRITVSNEDHLQSSDIWDAILTGIPQELVRALRELPDLWERLQIRNDISIQNLTELQTLELKSSGGTSECPFISAVSFRHAFLKMPTLTNLVLKGGFGVTTEMTEMWRREGRTIDADICS